MVTIYTERGPAGEVLTERKPFHFGRLMAFSLGTALLLSLIGAYNLNADVNGLINQEVPYIQQRIAEINPSSLAR
jgi:hypothetical protein